MFVVDASSNEARVTLCVLHEMYVVALLNRVNSRNDLVVMMTAL